MPDNTTLLGYSGRQEEVRMTPSSRPFPLPPCPCQRPSPSLEEGSGVRLTRAENCSDGPVERAPSSYEVGLLAELVNSQERAETHSGEGFATTPSADSAEDRTWAMVQVVVLLVLLLTAHLPVAALTPAAAAAAACTKADAVVVVVEGILLVMLP